MRATSDVFMTEVAPAFLTASRTRGVLLGVLADDR